MPKKKNLLGEKYGLLTVISELEERRNNFVLWKCICECGNTCNVTSVDLVHGRVRSCGCLLHKAKSEDLTSKRFGKLVVVRKIEGKKTKKRGQFWLCKCDCGNEVEISANSLKNVGAKSCGCINKENMRELGKSKYKDITGKTFGMLTVIKKMPSKNGRSMWLCKCSCDEQNEIVASGYDLNRKHVNSCGCLKKSLGEYLISKLLNDNNISFEINAHFDDCKFVDTNYHAYFDFYVENKYIIEYDGEQHFKETCFNGITKFDAKENFKKTQEHDKFKNDYCFKKNIPIIRIPYTHIDNLKIEDILLETSQFVLRKEGIA